MDFTEALKKIALAGVGAVAVAAEKTAEVVDDLSKKGEETVQKGKEANVDVTATVKEAANKAKDAVTKGAENIKKTFQATGCEETAEDGCCERSFDAEAGEEACGEDAQAGENHSGETAAEEADREFQEAVKDLTDSIKIFSKEGLSRLKVELGKANEAINEAMKDFDAKAKMDEASKAFHDMADTIRTEVKAGAADVKAAAEQAAANTEQACKDAEAEAAKAAEEVKADAEEAVADAADAVKDAAEDIKED